MAGRLALNQDIGVRLPGPQRGARASGHDAAPSARRDDEEPQASARGAHCALGSDRIAVPAWDRLRGHVFALLASAALAGCVSAPTEPEVRLNPVEGKPVPIDSPDPRYHAYLDLVRNMIKAKWTYP